MFKQKANKKFNCHKCWSKQEMLYNGRYPRLTPAHTWVNLALIVDGYLPHIVVFEQHAFYDMGIFCHTLLWRHNGLDSVSNHQPYDCLLKRLFRRRSKKTSKLRVTGLCEGNSPVNSPHKGPVTRKMFRFDDVIMFVFVMVVLSVSQWNNVIYSLISPWDSFTDTGQLYDSWVSG